MPYFRIPAATSTAILLLCLTIPVATRADEDAGEISYSRDIRPILADKCFACHGADAADRQSGLRLDESESAYNGGDSGMAAIVAGDPDNSELIRRVESTEDWEQMPPPSAKKALTTREKALLRKWVEQGGKYEKHWAFEAPTIPEVPRVSDLSQPEWVRNEIDAFVMRRLDQEQLPPTEEADKVTLLRRLSLDLTGLPPTPEEIDAFLRDDSSDAYQKQVERLLSSPHYGERWGRIWLDGARYADSDGYEKDKPRFVWAYRDWVVNALNRDLPYDQFIIEQLAGDLLPNATQDQLVATGFLRNSMLNEEGGVDPEQFRMEAMFDRMDALGKSVLGLTIQCAQCHDHKYDPFSQEDYYSLLAFLNDTHEASVPVYSSMGLKKRAEVLAGINEIEESIKHRHPDWLQQLASWEASLPESPNWTCIAPRQEVSGGTKYYILEDQSILAQGYATTRSASEFEITIPESTVNAFRLELLNHPDLPLSGPGRSIWGLGVLSEFEVEAAPADGSGEWKKLKFETALADVNPEEAPLHPQFDDKTDNNRVTGPVDYAIDGDMLTGWSIDIGPGRSNVPRQAIFVLDEPLHHASGTKLKIKLHQKHGGWNSDDNQTNNLGCFRFSVTEDEIPASELPPLTVERILDTPPDQRTEQELDQLFAYWRTTRDEFAAANEAIEALWKEHPEAVSQLVMADRENPRQSYILKRGDFLSPTEPVSKDVPSMLHPMEEESPDRLDLAKWIVDEQSPTVARSIVNRIWQTYFGIGLVETSEDFGLQGAPPSHPELLDWLAVEFMENGWSIKDFHRLIVNSATYRQSSNVDEVRLKRDPDNRLLSRGARFRMEAEGVRDIALAASGLLNPKLGGPPVCPPAPQFLFMPPDSYGPKTWETATDDDRYRRSIYTFRFRSIPYPVLEVFDAPPGNTACVRRVKSNTPLQALATLNEVVFLECARQLAMETLACDANTDDARLTLAFRRCTSRTPDEFELQRLNAFLAAQRERFASNETQAREFLALPTGDDSRTENRPEFPVSELAAWSALGRVLLNLDETITRQ